MGAAIIAVCGGPALAKVAANAAANASSCKAESEHLKVCEPDEIEGEPVVSKTEARIVAAELLGLDVENVKCSERGGSWIRVEPPNGEFFSFRGATWFGALEAIHKFLLAQVVANEKPTENESEDLMS